MYLGTKVAECRTENTTARSQLSGHAMMETPGSLGCFAPKISSPTELSHLGNGKSSGRLAIGVPLVVSSTASFSG